METTFYVTAIFSNYFEKINDSKHIEAIDDCQNFEDYFKQQVADGYISENVKPLKCICGCAEFKQMNEHFGVGHCLEEYSLQCTNTKCLKIVGRWSYGSW